MAQVLAGLLVAAGVALAVFALQVARRRQAAAGRPLAVVLLAAAWWGFAGALELSVEDLVTRVLWGDLKYIGIVVLPPAWLVFVLLFTGRRTAVTRRLVGLLAVEPVLVLSVLAVPATHDLFRYLPQSEVGEPLPVVAVGPLFWVHAVYSYLVIVVATVVFIRGLLRTSRVYRRLSVELAVAALLPWVANILFNLGVGPFALIDLTPFLFVLTGAVVVRGLLHGHLEAVARVARDVVVDSLADGVLVLDAFHRVVESNPAARRMLGPARLPVGAPVGDVLPRYPTDEVVLTTDAGPRTVEVRYQPLLDRSGAVSGEVVLLRDITERRAAEEQVQQLLAERTRVAGALQTALLPAVLPTVPGVVARALYRPAGDGREIGGDFYELFPLGDGGWCAVLGDVAGKGAEAAVVTARVRFTLRALSSEVVEPERMLTAVNAVLTDDGDDERFCTLAYVRLTPLDGGVRADVVLAGHLQPLLRRADGRVEAIGAPGTALGLLPDPELHVTTVDLSDGDALCLFTDGLVESRDGAGTELGTGRVADVLAAVDPRGGPAAADTTLAALGSAVRDWHGAQLRDDLAVLLLVCDGSSAPSSASAAQPVTPSPR